MIEHNGSLLLSVKFGLPLAVLGILVMLVVVYFLIVQARHDDDPDLYWVLSGIIGVATVVVIISSAFGYYPYKGDYHRLQPVSGKVAAIDSRFLTTSQYLVVTYDTGLTVRCDDSRCATVRVGDTLQLFCTKEHQFGSPLESDGWSCRWGSNS
jgi:hypothetical protein